jgi:hypothetical protein
MYEKQELKVMLALTHKYARVLELTAIAQTTI